MHILGRHQRRRQIHLLGTYGDMSRPAAHHLLKRFVYPGSLAWHHFIRYVLLALGIGFLLSGIVFFFAYNWAALHRFTKLSILGGLMLVSVIISVSGSMMHRIRRWFMLSAFLLAGTTLGVYGQIYQTGADDFDFYLAWSLLTLLWVVISRFPLLWMSYFALLNLVLITFLSQRMPAVSSMFSLFLIGSINLIFLIFSNYLPNGVAKGKTPAWMLQLLSVAALTSHVLCVLNGIYQSGNTYAPVFFVAVGLQWCYLCVFGLRRQEVFWPAAVGLSLIIAIAGALLKFSDDAWMMLTVSLFIAGSVGVLIAWIASLQKKWIHGTR
jgi:uncharacterized membrane protein